jgi:hypothetical protein
MALQLGALREALEDAGASPEKAAKAAEELAGYKNRPGVETRLTLLTWMVGGIYAVLIVLGAPALWLLLKIASKVGLLDVTDIPDNIDLPWIVRCIVELRGDVRGSSSMYAACASGLAGSVARAVIALGNGKGAQIGVVPRRRTDRVKSTRMRSLSL